MWKNKRKKFLSFNYNKQKMLSWNLKQKYYQNKNYISKYDPSNFIEFYQKEYCLLINFVFGGFYFSIPVNLPKLIPQLTSLSLMFNKTTLLPNGSVMCKYD
jgi:hypothetical protein